MRGWHFNSGFPQEAFRTNKKTAALAMMGNYAAERFDRTLKVCPFPAWLGRFHLRVIAPGF